MQTRGFTRTFLFDIHILMSTLTILNILFTLLKNSNNERLNKSNNAKVLGKVIQRDGKERRLENIVIFSERKEMEEVRTWKRDTEEKT